MSAAGDRAAGQRGSIPLALLAGFLFSRAAARIETRALEDGKARIAWVGGIGFRAAAEVEDRAAGAAHEPAVAAGAAQPSRFHHTSAGTPPAALPPRNSMTVISRGVKSRIRWPVTPRPQFTYRLAPPSRNSPRS